MKIEEKPHKVHWVFQQLKPFHIPRVLLTDELTFKRHTGKLQDQTARLAVFLKDWIPCSGEERGTNRISKPFSVIFFSLVPPKSRPMRGKHWPWITHGYRAPLKSSLVKASQHYTEQSHWSKDYGPCWLSLLMPSLIHTSFSNAEEESIKHVSGGAPEMVGAGGGHTPNHKTILNHLSSTS